MKEIDLLTCLLHDVHLCYTSNIVLKLWAENPIISHLVNLELEILTIIQKNKTEDAHPLR